MNHLVIHQSALTPSVLRVGLLEVGCAWFNFAAAAGGKHIKCLAAQVVGLNESVDDGRGGVPPHGEANPHGVVVGDVLATALDGGTRGLVVHLDGGTRSFVAPVEVGSGVKLFWDDLIEVGIAFFCQFLCGGLGGASGREVNY